MMACQARGLHKMRIKRALRKGKPELNMVQGPIVTKIILFSLPLMLTGILQLLYNAADIIVVGQYSGKEALAAVGSTGALINLIVNMFLGLSVGTSVAVARQYGAGDRAAVRDTVHTSMALALLGGLATGLFGLLAARTLLIWMGSPEDVLDAASLYMRIYFAGMPANMVYTFGSAILRAVGDTKRPLYFLTISGLLNVLLNLLFVIRFRMGVAGVALATVLSQVLSAVLVVRYLMQYDSAIRYIPRLTRLHRASLTPIFRIGLPAGLQGSLFSISNVIIQSSINSFGSVIMAGNAASANLEGFIYMAMNSIYQACLTFTSQNVGAKQHKRVRRILWICLGAVGVIGVSLDGLFSLLAPQLISIYNTDPAVIEMGVIRLRIICTSYFFCGMMEVAAGQLRGLGYSILPMITTLAVVCGLRIVWVYTVFAHSHTLQTLVWSYPLSWALAMAIHLISYGFIQRKFPRDNEPLGNRVFGSSGSYSSV